MDFKGTLSIVLIAIVVIAAMVLKDYIKDHLKRRKK
jgi:hypothetical protein